MTPRHSLPAVELRAAASLAYHLPGIRLVLQSGVQRRTVGTVVDGVEAFHPSTFRELVSCSIADGSLRLFRQELALPETAPVQVGLEALPPSRVVGSGVIESTGAAGITCSFATEEWWDDPMSVVLDQTPVRRDDGTTSLDDVVAALSSARVDCVLDEVLAVTLVTVRCADDADPATHERLAIDLGSALGAVIDFDHVLRG